jgi:hypothetical protein
VGGIVGGKLGEVTRTVLEVLPAKVVGHRLVVCTWLGSFVVEAALCRGFEGYGLVSEPKVRCPKLALGSFA